MLEQVCAFIHNYFTDPADVHEGRFVIEGGVFAPPFAVEGQYLRLVGSAFSDGVMRCPGEGLTDEAFDGEVWVMRPPAAFLRLVSEIEAWQEKHKSGGGFRSESFGGYSYTKTDAGAAGWTGVFRRRLDAYRKLA